MKLKYQLFFLALLSLLFPITGWFALKSVDKEFRLSIEQASENTLISLKSSVQQVLQNDSKLELQGLVAIDVENFRVDGDSTEWNTITAYSYLNQKEQLFVKIGLVDANLVMLIDSNDASKNNSSINSNANDHIIIALADERGLYKYNFKRQAEGLISTGSPSEDKPDFQAYWHEKAGGYILEVKFDSRNIHHVGFASVNKLTQSKFVTGTLQADTVETLQLLPIVSGNKSFQATVNSITPTNNHFEIKDMQNRVIYQSNKLPNRQAVSDWQWIITPIYQWLFAVNASNSKWFYRQDGMAGIKHTLKENGISYELKSMMPQGQQNMIQTLLQTGVGMISVVLLLMMAYLMYALFLAWRIKKLNRAMQTVLDDSGRFHVKMPSRQATDEIGQLSRGIESMLLEIHQYTQYLKDLGSRLSHEMKTPLAIVQSSLDNLEQDQHPEFLQRAQEGTKRLRFILNQLSELSQLKYTLEQTPKQNFDLNALIQQLAQSYQGFIPHLKTHFSSQPLTINGSPDLVAQLVDKLLDNAKDFIAADGYITISVLKNKDKVLLKIFNTDSQLPEKGGPSIFDSLVSVRSKKSSDSIHLGLGLHLVQLISRYHHAKVSAENTNNPKGVEFTIAFTQSI